MMNKKLSVLDRLKQDSFKKKENLNKNLNKQQEFNIVAVETEFIPQDKIIFNYNLIEDNVMREDLIHYETMLHLAKSNYHTKAGEILLEANQKYAHKKTGNFGIWLDHLKIGKKNAERLINRVKFIKENATTIEEQLYFESLPLSLTYEISSPNANKTLVQAVINKQITTRKQFINLKKSLTDKPSKKIEIDSINKLCKQLNSNIASIIKKKIETQTFNTNQATAIYTKMKQINEELQNLLIKLENSEKF